MLEQLSSLYEPCRRFWSATDIISVSCHSDLLWECQFRFNLAVGTVTPVQIANCHRYTAAFNYLISIINDR